jgi:hypothetical protein
MAKKIVIITAIINTDAGKEQNWTNADDYFNYELNQVLETILALKKKEVLNGTTSGTGNGTKYSLSIKNAHT